MSGFIKKIWNSDIMSAVLINGILLGIMLMLEPEYLSLNNLYALTKVLAVTALVAFSQMITIGSGGMNVSVGTTGALCAVLAGGAMERLGANWLAALLIALLAGVLCGALNGIFIYRFGGEGVAFFLTTLATSSIFQGISQMLTNGVPFYDISRSFIAIGDTRIWGLPSSLYIMLLFAAALFFLFTKLRIGWQILAYGGNAKSAMRYGVSKFRVVFLSNVFAGFVAAMAGVLALTRIQVAQPNMGSDWMLQSFAATLIGGTLLSGGRVNIFGTILGAFALTMVSNALVFLNVNTYWTALVYGVVILLAVGMDRVRFIVKQIGGRD